MGYLFFIFSRVLFIIPCLLFVCFYVFFRQFKKQKLKTNFLFVVQVSFSIFFVKYNYGICNVITDLDKAVFFPPQLQPREVSSEVLLLLPITVMVTNDGTFLSLQEIFLVVM